MEKRIVFSTNVARTTLNIFMKKNFKSYFISYIKVNSKCIIDQNVKPKAIKLLEENRRKVCDLGVRQRFLRYETKSTAIKKQLDKCGLHQSVKSLLIVRGS